MVTTSLVLRRSSVLRTTTLTKVMFNQKIYEVDDGDTLPLTVIVDAEGFHITQQDNMGIEDNISLSWSHLMGIFEIVEKLEGSFKNVRH